MTIVKEPNSFLILDQRKPVGPGSWFKSIKILILASYYIFKKNVDVNGIQVDKGMVGDIGQI